MKNHLGSILGLPRWLRKGAHRFQGKGCSDLIATADAFCSNYDSTGAYAAGHLRASLWNHSQSKQERHPPWERVRRDILWRSAGRPTDLTQARNWSGMWRKGKFCARTWPGEKACAIGRRLQISLRIPAPARQRRELS